MKQLKFSARGKNFTVDIGDAFMDNGSIIQFLPVNEGKRPVKNRSYITVTPTKPDWERIKQKLVKQTFEEYYGYKPAMTGVVMYVFEGC